MVAGLASEATPQGLESELMWLPRGVATHIEVRASPAAYPCAPCSHHTPGMHRGVNVTFTAGRWGAWLASPGQGIVPLSPLPCSCSLSRQLGGLMSHQTHPPIKFMVYPSIVWCSPVTVHNFIRTTSHACTYPYIPCFPPVTVGPTDTDPRTTKCRSGCPGT